MAGPVLRSLWSSTKKSFPSSSSPFTPCRIFPRANTLSRAFSGAPATASSSAASHSSVIDPCRLRNVVVIAHVHHGKTTLMDRLLRQCGFDTLQERAMDSISMERELGITITSKVTSISWKESELNIFDTPGHADFRGEVERVVGMVEGAILVVDAGEGPLLQTKFVLSKALKYGLRPILLLNKVDRPAVSENRCNEVKSQVFELFANLGATGEQLDFPVLYGSAREGWASTTFTKDPPAEAKNMSQLLDAIVMHVPPPTASIEAPFQMLVSMMEPDLNLGQILTGRIYSGIVRVGDSIHGLYKKDSGIEKIEDGKVLKLMRKKGTNMVLTNCAGAGDIISLAGLTSPSVGHTLAAAEVMSTLPTIELDPPTISMTFDVNNSPLAGRDGTHLTGGKIGERLMAEAETNLAINVIPGLSKSNYKVQGRGELQLGILIENMRHEGFEFSVSPPKVVYITKKCQKLEPIEEVTIEVNDEHLGLVLEVLSRRRGEVTDVGPVSGDVGRTRLSLTCPSRGLIGYRSVFSSDTCGTGFMHRAFLKYERYRGEIGNVRKGVLVSMDYGTITAHALMSLEARGALFVTPGMEAYHGMIVGEHSKYKDLSVNPVRNEELTNMCDAGKDESIKLSPPRLLTLEEAIGYVAPDELIEVTPKAVRLRKKRLDIYMGKKRSWRPMRRNNWLDYL